MTRFTFPVTFALGALLIAGNAATAGDDVQNKIGATGGRSAAATMTLGGKGTAAAAASAPDTELAWYHGYYRGYRRGFYNGYYGGGWAPYYAGYYPAVYPAYYPSYYGGYYPPVIGFGARIGPVGVGVYGINGTSSDVSAPALSLNLGGKAAQASKPATTNTEPGSYRYDGGPANPVPLPKQDASAPNGQTAPALPADTGLPVSLPKKASQPAKPYAYKAYGEK
jgi:hypothetical protein